MKSFVVALFLAVCLQWVTSNIVNCPNTCATNQGICSHGVCLCESEAAGDDCSISVAEMISTKLHTLMHAETANPEPAPVPEEYQNIQFDESEIMAKGEHRRHTKRMHPLRRRATDSAQIGRAVPNQPAPILPEGIPPCPSNCSAHGDCVATQNGIGQCKCYPGWTGVDCSSAVECPNNCMGQGNCVNGVCTCYAGFSGLDCSEIPTCRHNCFGHGYCISGHCQCDPGYAGPDCREAMFCMGDCSGHGSCSQGKCVCNTGFYGSDCANKGHDGLGDFCPNACSGHGNCHQQKCLCFRGFDGHDCGRFAHTDVPMDNVIDATAPHKPEDSVINTGDDEDPNYALFKGSNTNAPVNNGAPVNPAHAGEAATRVNKTIATNTQASVINIPMRIEPGPYPAPTSESSPAAVAAVTPKEIIEELPTHKNTGHHHHQVASEGVPSAPVEPAPAAEAN